jgi:hypothetical protein
MAACHVDQSNLAAICIYTNTIPYFIQNTQLKQNKYTNKIKIRNIKIQKYAK